MSHTGLNDLSVYTEEDTNPKKPNNPFSQQRKTQHSLLEIALEVLQTITCRKGPSKWKTLMEFSSHIMHAINVRQYPKLIIDEVGWGVQGPCVTFISGWKTLSEHFRGFDAKCPKLENIFLPC